ncbi:hypothetical protein SMD22_00870 (plasmid) [Brevibacillus halotolerans]|nr:hypothetical protein SMD22_00870 [Brevibacillus halotolerans]
MQAGDQFYVTWIESDEAEIIEDMLDEQSIPIEMLPTPIVIRDQVEYIMVCKDAFQILAESEVVKELGLLDFPTETRCFDNRGVLVWEK